MASLVALLTLTSALVALRGARPAAAASLKPTITKDVDANNDAVFSNTENVPKTVTYPWTVTYRLTIFGGTAPGPSGAFHTIVGISDSTTCDIGIVDCWRYDHKQQRPSNARTPRVRQAGTSTFVNTATLTYDSGGNDVLSNDSNVDFPGMTLDKSSTTT